MVKFKIIEKAKKIRSDETDDWFEEFEGVVEYEGENFTYRWYNGCNHQEASVLTESGWETDESKYPLINILYEALADGSYYDPLELGEAGEIVEWDEEDYL
tara:strand:+ start:83 stop:385 length:303 start_codon:yes stop_codon:yes gene_type:complete